MVIGKHFIRALLVLSSNTGHYGLNAGGVEFCRNALRIDPVKRGVDLREISARWFKGVQAPAPTAQRAVQEADLTSPPTRARRPGRVLRRSIAATRCRSRRRQERCGPQCC